MSQKHTLFQSTTMQSLYTEGQMWCSNNSMKIGLEFVGREIWDDYQKQNFKMKKKSCFHFEKKKSPTFRGQICLKSKSWGFKLLIS